MLLITVLLSNCSDIYSDEGSILYTSYASNPREQQLDDQLFSQFKQQYPNIHVRRRQEEAQQILYKAPSFFSGNDGTGVITFRNDRMLVSMWDEGYLSDISDIWEREHYNRHLLPVFRNPHPVIETPCFLPISWEWHGFFYRPSVFRTYGVEVPENWDEFLLVCETLKKSGITPLAIGVKFYWPTSLWFDYLVLRMHGSGFYKDLLTGDVSFDSEEIHRVIDTWGQLVREEYFISDAISYTWKESIELVAEEQAAMVLSSSSLLQHWPYRYRTDIDFFPFPSVETRFATSSIERGEIIPMEGYVLDASTEDIGAAKRFLAYLGSRETQNKRIRIVDSLPTRNDVATNTLSEIHKKAIDIAQEVEFGFPGFLNSFPRDFTDRALRLFTDFVTLHAGTEPYEKTHDSAEHSESDPTSVPAENKASIIRGTSVPLITRRLQEYSEAANSE